MATPAPAGENLANSGIDLHIFKERAEQELIDILDSVRPLVPLLLSSSLLPWSSAARASVVFPVALLFRLVSRCPALGTLFLR